MRLQAALDGRIGNNDTGRRALSADRRQEQRRTLRLRGLTSTVSADDVPVVVRDISTDGLLLQGPPEMLAKHAMLTIDLPEVGPVDARVAWRSGRYYGCAFVSPIPAHAISAALLKADFGSDADGPSITETDDHSAETARQSARDVRLGVALILSILLWGALAAVAGLVVLSQN